MKRPDPPEENSDQTIGVSGGFLVFNNTDCIYAWPDPFATLLEAQVFIDEFPKRYASQGYYLTARRERIDPKDVDLVIEIATQGADEE